MKKDVLSQLPTKNRHMVVLDPGSIKVSKVMKSSHRMMDKMKVSEILCVCVPVFEILS